MADNSVSKNNGETGVLQLNQSLGRRKSDLSAMTSVGNTELIKYADKYGLFTPLTDAELPEESDKNLQQLILTMKQQLSQLQQENLQLKQSLEEERIKHHRTPDDFATAISHSIDSLQTRLNDTKNPLSRFAIKAFDIDMRVYAEVTSIGTIDYRFVSPEEQVDPNRLTQIKMSVVPLPKENLSGSWTAPEFTPMRDIEEIQGIGEVYQKRLNKSQIYTIGDLLSVGTRVRSKVELAKLLEVDRNKLSEWLNQAELMTIRDIDGRAAEVLAEAGIANLNQLAQQEASALTTAYNTIVQEKAHASLKPIIEETVQKWIDTASAYMGTHKTGETV